MKRYILEFARDMQKQMNAGSEDYKKINNVLRAKNRGLITDIEAVGLIVDISNERRWRYE